MSTICEVSRGVGDTSVSCQPYSEVGLWGLGEKGQGFVVVVDF